MVVVGEVTLQDCESNLLTLPELLSRGVMLQRKVDEANAPMQKLY